jgi:hypothetical protein
LPVFYILEGRKKQGSFIQGTTRRPSRVRCEEVRDAKVAQASRGKHEPEEPGTTERSRVTTGGAKGVRKANPESSRPSEEEPPGVPATDKQGGEDLWQRHKAERGVWSQGMLEVAESML